MIEQIENKSPGEIEAVTLSQIAEGIYHLLVNTQKKWTPYQVALGRCSDTQMWARVYVGESEIVLDDSFVEIVLPREGGQVYAHYDNQNKNQIEVVFIYAPQLIERHNHVLDYRDAATMATALVEAGKMPKFTCIENTTEVEEYCFICPGCDCGHWVRVRGESPVWQWNGNVNKPTVSPSLHVDPGGRSQCHSFIRDGQIQFLDDCWHALKGQTVEIPDWE